LQVGAWIIAGRYSYEVVTASSIDEAADKLQQMEFDLVVLDIKLKNESGLDLLQKIIKERHEMPVILCSAFSCNKEELSAWLADGYIVKSGNLSELKQEITRVLSKRTLCKKSSLK